MNLREGNYLAGKAGGGLQMGLPQSFEGTPVGADRKHISMQRYCWQGGGGGGRLQTLGRWYGLRQLCTLMVSEANRVLAVQ